jgi:small subunit ribosomal protein S18
MAARTQRSNRRRAKPAARRSPVASCALCQDNVAWVDYKNIGLLRRYMSDRGRIRARQSTGNCAQHQDEVSVAIKTARELVLLPYAPRMAGTTEGGSS